MKLIWFWSFVFYSFIGFLLEVAYAWASRGRKDRKGLLLLPLCPVYGLGACGILYLAPTVEKNIFFLVLLGAGVATGVEYITAVWYERVLGVSFWDYRDLPGNLHGRVCLPFGAAWGVLTLGLVYWVHPWAAEWMVRIPLGITLSTLVLVGTDLVVASVMMRRTGDRDCLRWYERVK